MHTGDLAMPVFWGDIIDMDLALCGPEFLIARKTSPSSSPSRMWLRRFSAIQGPFKGSLQSVDFDIPAGTGCLFTRPSAGHARQSHPWECCTCAGMSCNCLEASAIQSSDLRVQVLCLAVAQEQVQKFSFSAVDKQKPAAILRKRWKSLLRLQQAQRADAAQQEVFTIGLVRGAHDKATQPGVWAPAGHMLVDDANASWRIRRNFSISGKVSTTPGLGACLPDRRWFFNSLTSGRCYRNLQAPHPGSRQVKQVFVAASITSSLSPLHC